MYSSKSIARAVVVTGSLCAGFGWSAPKVFSGSGAAATTALNAFRTAIGGVKLDGTDANPNTQVVDANKTVIIPVDRFQSQATLFADPYVVSGDRFAIFSP